jgi:Beige/BEACH domain
LLAALTAQPTLGTAAVLLQPAHTPQGRIAPSTAAAAAGALLEASGGWLPRVTRAWQLGRLSNFSYLLYLNLAAGRSFNDLAQWPVFPWVLRDYSSAVLDLCDEAAYRDLTKPMGAQDPARLEIFRQRCALGPLCVLHNACFHACMRVWLCIGQLQWRQLPCFAFAASTAPADLATHMYTHTHTHTPQLPRHAGAEPAC